MGRRHPTLALLAAGVAGLVVVALVGHQLLTGPGAGPGPRAPGDSARAPTGSADVSLSSAAFTVSGDLDGQLSPGRSVAIDLVLANPNDVAISVARLRVVLRSVDAPRADAGHPCGRADFTVTQPPVGLEVSLPAAGSGTLGELAVPRADWPRVGMVDRPSNQDGCQGASLRLGYVATARSR